jgi:hypothetical protein
VRSEGVSLASGQDYALKTEPCQTVSKNDIAMPTLTTEIINAAILGFEEQKRRIDVQIDELRAMLSPGSGGAPAGKKAEAPKKRGMSAAGRKAIAEAQRKRWAAQKGQTEPKATTTVKKPKRKLSEEGRAAIVAAVKKRWAAKKAAAAESGLNRSRRVILPIWGNVRKGRMEQVGRGLATRRGRRPGGSRRASTDRWARR